MMLADSTLLYNEGGSKDDKSTRPLTTHYLRLPISDRTCQAVGCQYRKSRKVAVRGDAVQ